MITTCKVIDQDCSERMMECTSTYSTMSSGYQSFVFFTCLCHHRKPYTIIRYEPHSLRSMRFYRLDVLEFSSVPPTKDLAPDLANLHYSRCTQSASAMSQITIEQVKNCMILLMTLWWNLLDQSRFRLVEICPNGNDSPAQKEHQPFLSLSTNISDCCHINIVKNCIWVIVCHNSCLPHSLDTTWFRDLHHFRVRNSRYGGRWKLLNILTRISTSSWSSGDPAQIVDQEGITVIPSRFTAGLGHILYSICQVRYRYLPYVLWNPLNGVLQLLQFFVANPQRYHLRYRHRTFLMWKQTYAGQLLADWHRGSCAAYIVFRQDS